MENISKKMKPCEENIFFPQKLATENAIKKCANKYPLAHIPTKNPQLLMINLYIICHQKTT